MDLSANMFYKVKFSVAAKDKSDDLLWKIVLHIMNWQTTKWNKKGKTILTDNLHAWSDIKNGSRILTKSNIVYIESDCFWEGQETVTKWACKITETPPLERRVAPRTWITEIGFEREKGNDSAVFSCVLSYEDRAGFIGPYQKVPEPSVPRLIKSIVQDNSLIVSSGIDSVSGKPERLYVGDWPAFLDRIENEERSLPYIYISPRVVDVEPLTTELLIDPNALAEVVYGNALVFYSNDIGFTQEAIYMNPEYACYNGAIKVYQPGASKSFRNHFIGAQQIEECGSDEIIGYLRRAFSQNVHFYDSFFRIEECRRIKENYLTNTRFSQQFARITALVNQVKFDANAKVGQIEEEALTMLQQEEQSRLAAEKDRDEYKNENRQIVMFTTVSRLLGSFAFSEKMLIEFDINRYTKEEVAITIQDLLELEPNCFSRTKPPSASFYSSLFKFVAGKYSINSIQAIQAKNRLLWSGTALLDELHLSDELLEQVRNKLPVQPWPIKIHERVAKELNLQINVVSDAIAYLIFTNKFSYQVYGFVFDENGKVLAESEHFGRSVEEARIKQKELAAFYERKFGF